jgi:hypothetical protein
LFHLFSNLPLLPLIPVAIFFLISFFPLSCQSKNLAVSGGGQVVLLAYLSTLTFNRLTTFISLFSTTQPLNFDNGHHEPLIHLGWAIIVFGLMVSGNTPLCYKRVYSTFITRLFFYIFAAVG